MNETSLPAPSLWQTRLLLALAGIGLLMLIGGGLTLLPMPNSMQVAGAYSLTLVLIVAAAWLPYPWLGQRIGEFLEQWADRRVGGYYGSMSLSCFLMAEGKLLIQSLREFEFTREAWTGAVLQWITGFSVESMWNAIQAALWPIFLVQQTGVEHLLALVALTWLLHAGIVRLFRDQIDALESSADDSADSPAVDQLTAGNLPNLPTIPSLPTLPKLRL